MSPVRRHLLVVDDEPHIGLLLRPHLERHGYVVSLARTLADARRALELVTGWYESARTGRRVELSRRDN